MGTTHPASRYALVLWDHGDGWAKDAGTTVYPKAVARDDTNDDVLRMAELRQALEAGMDQGVQLNIVGFDACYMGMAEVVLPSTILLWIPF